MMLWFNHIGDTSPCSFPKGKSGQTMFQCGQSSHIAIHCAKSKVDGSTLTNPTYPFNFQSPLGPHLRGRPGL